MTKKARIEIRREENLAEIDEELDEALDQLEKTNGRIGELLASLDNPQQAEQGEAGADEPPAAPEDDEKAPS